MSSHRRQRQLCFLKSLLKMQRDSWLLFNEMSPFIFLNTTLRRFFMASVETVIYIYKQ